MRTCQSAQTGQPAAPTGRETIYRVGLDEGRVAKRVIVGYTAGGVGGKKHCRTEGQRNNDREKPGHHVVTKGSLRGHLSCYEVPKALKSWQV